MSKFYLSFIWVVAVLAWGCSDPVDPAAGGADSGEDIFFGDGPVEDVRADGAPDVARDSGPPADTADDVPPEDVATDTPSGQADVDECDRDNDGVLSMECGGDDCDDLDRTRAPGVVEYCDEVDNDCDGQRNEDLECWFYAHTGDDLYEVDPFAKSLRRVTGVPDLFDMDTHPDGTLYGLTPEALFRFDRGANQWAQIGEIESIEDANGLAIDSEGVAFVTAMNDVYTVDLQTARVTRVGALGGDYYSSGDCVVNKADTLFVTSKDRDDRDATNEFVLVDRGTGQGTLVGDVGFRSVYALTAGWGRIFGMTSRGELIEIDRNTGQGELIHTFDGMRWYGAASTPSR
jgi:hypothetical protein